MFKKIVNKIANRKNNFILGGYKFPDNFQGFDNIYLSHYHGSLSQNMTSINIGEDKQLGSEVIKKLVTDIENEIKILKEEYEKLDEEDKLLTIKYEEIEKEIETVTDEELKKRLMDEMSSIVDQSDTFSSKKYEISNIIKKKETDKYNIILYKKVEDRVFAEEDYISTEILPDSILIIPENTYVLIQQCCGSYAYSDNSTLYKFYDFFNKDGEPTSIVISKDELNKKFREILKDEDGKPLKRHLILNGTSYILYGPGDYICNIIHANANLLSQHGLVADILKRTVFTYLPDEKIRENFSINTNTRPTNFLKNYVLFLKNNKLLFDNNYELHSNSTGDKLFFQLLSLLFLSTDKLHPKYDIYSDRFTKLISETFKFQASKFSNTKYNSVNENYIDKTYIEVSQLIEKYKYEINKYKEHVLEHFILLFLYHIIYNNIEDYRKFFMDMIDEYKDKLINFNTIAEIIDKILDYSKTPQLNFIKFINLIKYNKSYTIDFDKLKDIFKIDREKYIEIYNFLKYNIDKIEKIIFFDRVFSILYILSIIQNKMDNGLKIDNITKDFSFYNNLTELITKKNKLSQDKTNLYISDSCRGTNKKCIIGFCNSITRDTQYFTNVIKKAFLDFKNILIDQHTYKLDKIIPGEPTSKFLSDIYPYIESGLIKDNFTSLLFPRIKTKYIFNRVCFNISRLTEFVSVIKTLQKPFELSKDEQFELDTLLSRYDPRFDTKYTQYKNNGYFQDILDKIIEESKIKIKTDFLKKLHGNDEAILIPHIKQQLLEQYDILNINYFTKNIIREGSRSKYGKYEYIDISVKQLEDTYKNLIQIILNELHSYPYIFKRFAERLVDIPVIEQLLSPLNIANKQLMSKIEEHRMYRNEIKKFVKYFITVFTLKYLNHVMDNPEAIISRETPFKYLKEDILVVKHDLEIVNFKNRDNTYSIKQCNKYKLKTQVPLIKNATFEDIGEYPYHLLMLFNGFSFKNGSDKLYLGNLLYTLFDKDTPFDVFGKNYQFTVNIFKSFLKYSLSIYPFFHGHRREII